MSEERKKEEIIPWVRPNFLGSEEAFTQTLATIKTLLSAGQVTNSGQYNQRLENQCRDYFHAFTQSVSSGSTALLIAVKSLKRKKNKTKIILPSFTFNATLSAVLLNNYQPLFCDIDPRTWLLDLKHLKKLLHKHSDVRAVMAVNCFGVPVELRPLYEILYKSTDGRCKIIYDDAHGFGSLIEQKTHQGEIPHTRIISLHATKVVPAIEGGLVLTTSSKKFQRVKQLANHGFGETWSENIAGFNARLDEIRSLIFLEQFQRLDTILENRKNYWQQMKQATDRHKDIFQTQEIPAGVASSYANFCVSINPQYSIEKIMKEFEQHGIMTRRYFFPLLHRLNMFGKKYRPSLPHTEAVAEQILSLPLHSQMSQETLERVCRGIYDVAQSCP